MLQLLSYFTAGLYVWTALAVSNVSTDSLIHAVVPKNIVFGVTWGSPSHVHWVLDILDEVAARGHNVVYAARDDFTRLGEPYERIKTVEIGRKYSEEDERRKDWPNDNLIQLSASIMSVRTPVYAAEYTAFRALFRDTNADAVVCDLYTAACEDAALSLSLPFITTSSLAVTPDARAPYLENTVFTLKEPTSLTMSFALRFHNRFIAPLRLMAVLYKPLQRNAEARQKVSAPPFLSNPWKDSLKIINSAFGFEPARPLGPLVEMVGPIVQRKYPPMTPYLKEYLDSHQRIAYIALGQMFAPLKGGLDLILGAVLDNFEKGVIDGFIWATVLADTNQISNPIRLPSGKLYNITDILAGRDPHCRLVKRVSQQAVLQHPAVSVFLTHGGKSSLFESLFHGVRLVALPLTGDQPFNARTVVSLGLGGSFEQWSSVEQASKTLETVVLDVTGKIRENVKRYQHLVRIRSARGASKGADLVEEVAFMHKGGLLPHRYEASRQMSYMKATNLDLYVALVVLVIGTVYGSWRVVRSLTASKETVTAKRKVL